MTGVSWPQSNIPGVWQGISMLFPSTFGVRGFLGISSMGASLSDIEPQFQALWIQTLVYFLLTCVVYRYQINSTRVHAIERVRMLRQTAHDAAEEKREKEKEHQ
jgi:ABC-2 type transport system permease protein